MANQRESGQEHVVDVRPDLRAGREPFAKIMAAAAAVAVGDTLVLYATFKPVPLLGVLKAQGFESEATPLDDGEWRIDLRRLAGPGAAPGTMPGLDQASAETDPAVQTGAGPADAVHLDNRGLEPPEPMVRTLEAVHALVAGQQLIGQFDRTPMFLLPKLKDLGFVCEVDTLPNGQATVSIKHGPAGD